MSGCYRLTPTDFSSETDKRRCGPYCRRSPSPGHDSANHDPDTRPAAGIFSPAFHIPLASSAPVFVAGRHTRPRAVYGILSPAREQAPGVYSVQTTQRLPPHLEAGAAAVFFDFRWEGMGVLARGCTWFPLRA